MVLNTRSTPDFPHESQNELYNVRREFALMVKFPYDPEYEQEYISAMTAERASEVLAKTTEELEAYKKKTSKKSKGKVTTTAATKTAAGTSKRNPTKTGSGVLGDTPADELATDEDPEQNENETDVESVNETEPSDSSSSSSSSDDDDPRLRTSKKDKRTVRGRTPRIDTRKTTKKLFKMDPPAKYSGEKDKDRTYNAVHQFLSQLSRYLRLATNVDMDDDIVEYVLGFLDGFAYRWFEALDKGEIPFRWKEFEAAFRTKFIPREHVQLSMKRYLAIKQNGRSVSEFIVERESLENTLGDAISKVTKETSFRENLDGWLIKKLVTFHDLPYEEYKRKAESTDQDMRERKLGPYSTKKASSEASTKSTSRNTTNKTATKSSDKKSNEQKPKTSTNTKDGPSKNQMRKDGVCFTCKKKGHIAKDCPQNENLENNSIRIIPNTKPDKATRIRQYTKRDGRSNIIFPSLYPLMTA